MVSYKKKSLTSFNYLLLTTALASAWVETATSQDILPGSAAPTSKETLKKPALEAKKWSPQVNLDLAAGSVRSIAQPGIMAPLVQTDDAMIFMDVRGMLDSRREREGNIGLGYSKLMPEGFIWRTYGFYDRRLTSTNKTVQQITVGGDILTENYDLRANVYMPITRPIQTRHASSTTKRNQVHSEYVVFKDQHFVEVPMGGFDAEVGRQVPGIEGLRLFGGYYHFAGKDVPNLDGVRLRGEYPLTPWLALKVEGQYDRVRGAQGFLGMRMRYALGARDASASELTPLEKRMMTPVERDVDVVTRPSKKPRVTRDQTQKVKLANGEEAVKLYVTEDPKLLDPTNPGKGTAESPIHLGHPGGPAALHALTQAGQFNVLEHQARGALWVKGEYPGSLLMAVRALPQVRQLVEGPGQAYARLTKENLARHQRGIKPIKTGASVSESLTGSATDLTGHPTVDATEPSTASQKRSHGAAFGAGDDAVSTASASTSSSGGGGGGGGGAGPVDPPRKKPTRRPPGGGGGGAPSDNNDTDSSSSAPRTPRSVGHSGAGTDAASNHTHVSTPDTASEPASSVSASGDADASMLSSRVPSRPASRVRTPASSHATSLASSEASTTQIEMSVHSAAHASHVAGSNASVQEESESDSVLTHASSQGDVSHGTPVPSRMSTSRVSRTAQTPLSGASRHAPQTPAHSAPELASVLLDSHISPVATPTYSAPHPTPVTQPPHSAAPMAGAVLGAPEASLPASAVASEEQVDVPAPASAPRGHKRRRSDDTSPVRSLDFDDAKSDQASQIFRAQDASFVAPAMSPRASSLSPAASVEGQVEAHVELASPVPSGGIPTPTKPVDSSVSASAPAMAPVDPVRGPSASDETGVHARSPSPARPPVVQQDAHLSPVASAQRDAAVSPSSSAVPSPVLDAQNPSSPEVASRSPSPSPSPSPKRVRGASTSSVTSSAAAAAAAAGAAGADASPKSVDGLLATSLSPASSGPSQNQSPVGLRKTGSAFSPFDSSNRPVLRSPHTPLTPAEASPHSPATHQSARASQASGEAVDTAAVVPASTGSDADSQAFKPIESASAAAAAAPVPSAQSLSNAQPARQQDTPVEDLHDDGGAGVTPSATAASVAATPPRGESPSPVQAVSAAPKTPSLVAQAVTPPADLSRDVAHALSPEPAAMQPALTGAPEQAALSASMMARPVGVSPKPHVVEPQSPDAADTSRHRAVQSPSPVQEASAAPKTPSPVAPVAAPADVQDADIQHALSPEPAAMQPALAGAPEQPVVQDRAVVKEPRGAATPPAPSKVQNSSHTRSFSENDLNPQARATFMNVGPQPEEGEPTASQHGSAVHRAASASAHHSATAPAQSLQGAASPSASVHSSVHTSVRSEESHRSTPVGSTGRLSPVPAEGASKVTASPSSKHTGSHSAPNSPTHHMDAVDMQGGAASEASSVSTVVIHPTPTQSPSASPAELGGQGSEQDDAEHQSSDDQNSQNGQASPVLTGDVSQQRVPSPAVSSALRDDAPQNTSTSSVTSPPAAEFYRTSVHAPSPDDKTGVAHVAPRGADQMMSSPRDGDGDMDELAVLQSFSATHSPVNVLEVAPEDEQTTRPASVDRHLGGLDALPETNISFNGSSAAPSPVHEMEDMEAQAAAAEASSPAPATTTSQQSPAVATPPALTVTRPTPARNARPENRADTPVTWGDELIPGLDLSINTDALPAPAQAAASQSHVDVHTSSAGDPDARSTPQSAASEGWRSPDQMASPAAASPLFHVDAHTSAADHDARSTSQSGAPVVLISPEKMGPLFDDAFWAQEAAGIVAPSHPDAPSASAGMGDAASSHTHPVSDVPAPVVSGADQDEQMVEDQGAKIRVPATSRKRRNTRSLSPVRQTTGSIESDRASLGHREPTVENFRALPAVPAGAHNDAPADDASVSTSHASEVVRQADSAEVVDNGSETSFVIEVQEMLEETSSDVASTGIPTPTRSQRHPSPSGSSVASGSAVSSHPSSAGSQGDGENDNDDARSDVSGGSAVYPTPLRLSASQEFAVHTDEDEEIDSHVSSGSFGRRSLDQTSRSHHASARDDASRSASEYSEDFVEEEDTPQPPRVQETPAEAAAAAATPPRMSPRANLMGRFEDASPAQAGGDRTPSQGLRDDADSDRNSEVPEELEFQEEEDADDGQSTASHTSSHAASDAEPVVEPLRRNADVHPPAASVASENVVDPAAVLADVRAALEAWAAAQSAATPENRMTKQEVKEHSRKLVDPIQLLLNEEKLDKNAAEVAAEVKELTGIVTRVLKDAPHTRAAPLDDHPTTPSTRHQDSDSEEDDDLPPSGPGGSSRSPSANHSAAARSAPSTSSTPSTPAQTTAAPSDSLNKTPELGEDVSGYNETVAQLLVGNQASPLPQDDSGDNDTLARLLEMHPTVGMPGTPQVAADHSGPNDIWDHLVATLPQNGTPRPAVQEEASGNGSGIFGEILRKTAEGPTGVAASAQHLAELSDGEIPDGDMLTLVLEQAQKGSASAPAAAPHFPVSSDASDASVDDSGNWSILYKINGGPTRPAGTAAPRPPLAATVAEALPTDDEMLNQKVTRTENGPAYPFTPPHTPQKPAFSPQPGDEAEAMKPRHTLPRTPASNSGDETRAPNTSEMTLDELVVADSPTESSGSTGSQKSCRQTPEETAVQPGPNYQQALAEAIKENLANMPANLLAVYATDGKSTTLLDAMERLDAAVLDAENMYDNKLATDLKGEFKDEVVEAYLSLLVQGATAESISPETLLAQGKALLQARAQKQASEAQQAATRRAIEEVQELDISEFPEPQDSTWAFSQRSDLAFSQVPESKGPSSNALAASVIPMANQTMSPMNDEAFLEALGDRESFTAVDLTLTSPDRPPYQPGNTLDQFDEAAAAATPQRLDEHSSMQDSLQTPSIIREHLAQRAPASPPTVLSSPDDSLRTPEDIRKAKEELKLFMPGAGVGEKPVKEFDMSAEWESLQRKRRELQAAHGLVTPVRESVLNLRAALSETTGTPPFGHRTSSGMTSYLASLLSPPRAAYPPLLVDGRTPHTETKNSIKGRQSFNTPSDADFQSGAAAWARIQGSDRRDTTSSPAPLAGDVVPAATPVWGQGSFLANEAQAQQETREDLQKARVETPLQGFHEDGDAEADVTTNDSRLHPLVLNLDTTQGTPGAGDTSNDRAEGRRTLLNRLSPRNTAAAVSSEKRPMGPILAWDMTVPGQAAPFSPQPAVPGPRTLDSLQSPRGGGRTPPRSSDDSGSESPESLHEVSGSAPNTPQVLRGMGGRAVPPVLDLGQVPQGDDSGPHTSRSGSATPPSTSARTQSARHRPLSERGDDRTPPPLPSDGKSPRALEAAVLARKTASAGQVSQSESSFESEGSPSAHDTAQPSPRGVLNAAARVARTSPRGVLPRAHISPRPGVPLPAAGAVPSDDIQKRLERVAIATPLPGMNADASASESAPVNQAVDTSGVTTSSISAPVAPVEMDQQRSGAADDASDTSSLDEEDVDLTDVSAMNEEESKRLLAEIEAEMAADAAHSAAAASLPAEIPAEIPAENPAVDPWESLAEDEDEEEGPSAQAPADDAHSVAASDASELSAPGLVGRFNGGLTREAARRVKLRDGLPVKRAAAPAQPITTTPTARRPSAVSSAAAAASTTPAGRRPSSVGSPEQRPGTPSNSSVTSAASSKLEEYAAIARQLRDEAARNAQVERVVVAHQAKLSEKARQEQVAQFNKEKTALAAAQKLVAAQQLEAQNQRRQSEADLKKAQDEVAIQFNSAKGRLGIALKNAGVLEKSARAQQPLATLQDHVRSLLKPTATTRQRLAVFESEASFLAALNTGQKSPKNALDETDVAALRLMQRLIALERARQHAPKDSIMEFDIGEGRMLTEDYSVFDGQARRTLKDEELPAAERERLLHEAYLGIGEMKAAEPTFFKRRGSGSNAASGAGTPRDWTPRNAVAASGGSTLARRPSSSSSSSGGTTPTTGSTASPSTVSGQPPRPAQQAATRLQQPTTGKHAPAAQPQPELVPTTPPKHRVVGADSSDEEGTPGSASKQRRLRRVAAREHQRPKAQEQSTAVTTTSTTVTTAPSSSNGSELGVTGQTAPMTGAAAPQESEQGALPAAPQATAAASRILQPSKLRRHTPPAPAPLTAANIEVVQRQLVGQQGVQANVQPAVSASAVTPDVPSVNLPVAGANRFGGAAARRLVAPPAVSKASSASGQGAAAGRGTGAGGKPGGSSAATRGGARGGPAQGNGERR